MSSKTTGVDKMKLISVMEEENSVLDTILEQQRILHGCVKEKNWTALQDTMKKMQVLTDRFVSLEEDRTALTGGINLAEDKAVAPVLFKVRGKLQKSKAESKALSEYISITRKFLQGVFDSVVPQRRNTLYSRNGAIVKPELNSLVVDRLM